MADRQTELRIGMLSSKRNDLQTQISKKRQQINEIQDEISDLEEQVQKYNEDISKLRIRAERNSNREDETQSEDPFKNAEVEESDGATTTASLDASSQSTGGDFGGWRHYNKVGEPFKRKKKKKRLHDFINHIWNYDGDGGE